jgi:hypothetical protein
MANRAGGWKFLYSLPLRLDLLFDSIGVSS